MSGRTDDDFAHERTALDAAHQQNETQRDSFIALAHTALFAASISFVGSVAPLRTAIWRPVLVTGWTFSVVGLLALTFSFGAARREIDRRRAALNDETPPAPSRVLGLLHTVATWSFPLSLLCLFSFVTSNVVSADEPSPKPPAATQSAVTAVAPQRGCQPAAAGTDACACPAPTAAQPTPTVNRHAGDVAAAARPEPHRPGRSGPGRRHAGAASPDPDAATATSSAPAGEEVTGRGHRRRRCF
ncbi:hypothetical protein [Sphingomonas corticis]|uniref:Uncharacterized protein n=1 Tax=Sphingomonas corticis TaxID=2722791 RepID=A0ABX1CTK4_9SPHN|nr:hypothetical protein [Sphingomonas corticis]NJR79340.1 hypothetical protein [Sphingomonas corticis]